MPKQCCQGPSDGIRWQVCMHLSVLTNFDMWQAVVHGLAGLSASWNSLEGIHRFTASWDSQCCRSSGQNSSSSTRRTYGLRLADDSRQLKPLSLVKALTPLRARRYSQSQSHRRLQPQTVREFGLPKTFLFQFLFSLPPFRLLHHSGTFSYKWFDLTFIPRYDERLAHRTRHGIFCKCKTSPLSL